LIRGNELAYADYVNFSFRLFGLRMSSLYYFYFVLLGISCLAFIAEFRMSPFPMFLLVTYLGGLGFLQNYAQSKGYWLGTLANSRAFEALSLLPAMHIFLAVWRRASLTWLTLTTVTVQSALLAFVVDCRITARWQVAMIIAAALGLILVESWRRPPWRLRWGWDSWSGVWAAGVAVCALAGHMAFINFAADARYEGEPKYHVIWHEVLTGLLGSSTELQREYLGKIKGAGSSTDQDGYDAVSYELTKRNDQSSAVAVVENGRIAVDVGRGWNEYERLARALVFKMAVEHPGEVVGGIQVKYSSQVDDYLADQAMSAGNMAVATLFAALGGIVWLSLGALAVPNSKLLSGAGAAIVVLGFSSILPTIEPSILSVGTLLSYVMAIAILIVVLIVLAARGVNGMIAPMLRTQKRKATRISI
jgi:hypothetical protein